MGTDPTLTRTYYGAAPVEPPVWTWEIPAYFFVGGAAGAASLIAAVTRGRASAQAIATSSGRSVAPPA